MIDKNPSQSYLSCAEVARHLGLSRQRFWELRKEGVFPQPQTNNETGRPYYTDEQLEVCRDLRRRNIGLNGKVVLFYSARSTASVTKPTNKKSKSKPKSNRHQPIIEALKTFGLTGVSDDHVDETIGKVFPDGAEGVEQGEIVRQVFLHIQRQNSSE